MQLLTSLIAWFRHKLDLLLHSGFPIFFWVRPRWSVDEITDQTGKVVLVTGGNSGTGYATSLALYNAGAKVYLACRNEKKAREAMAEIEKGGQRTLTGFIYPKSKNTTKKGQLEFIKLDLTDLESVERCVDEFLKKEDKLDTLFCNAGIMATPEGQYTKQGYTLQFGTNVLGHQRLTSLLLPLLLKSPPTEPSRVIFTSSAGHAAAPSGGVDFRSVVRDRSEPEPREGQPPRRGKYERTKWVEYGQAKWGDVALARYLHNEYGRQGRLISVALHPGMVATNLAGHFALTPYIIKFAPWLGRLITRSPAIGASNQIWVATIPDHAARWLSGEYIVPFQRIGRPRPDVEDNVRCEQVWQWCEEQGKKRA